MSTTTATSLVPSSAGQIVQAAKATIVGRAPQNASTNTSQQQVAPSPGRFRHPRMTEIAKRRSGNEFTSRNVQIVVLNTAVLLATIFTSRWTQPLLNTVVQHAHLKTIALDSTTILNLLRLIFVSNIYFALRPVLPHSRTSDPLDDIALTPSQRALLGLPRSQSNTPQSGNYATPPKYRRSSPSFAGKGTPGSNGTGGRSISGNYSASPLSTSRYTVGFSPTPQQQSATPGRRLSGSPFSPSSPLFSRALVNSSSMNEIAQNPDFTESTRSLLAGNTSTSSFSSSLRRSHSMRERGKQQEPGTPSPSAREKSKVNVQPGLNYKWLYEKNLKVGKNGNVEYD